MNSKLDLKWVFNGNNPVKVNNFNELMNIIREKNLEFDKTRYVSRTVLSEMTEIEKDLVGKYLTDHFPDKILTLFRALKILDAFKFNFRFEFSHPDIDDFSYTNEDLYNKNLFSYYAKAKNIKEHSGKIDSIVSLETLLKWFFIVKGTVSLVIDDYSTEGDDVLPPVKEGIFKVTLTLSDGNERIYENKNCHNLLKELRYMEYETGYMSYMVDNDEIDRWSLVKEKGDLLKPRPYWLEYKKPPRFYMSDVLVRLNNQTYYRPSGSLSVIKRRIETTPDLVGEYYLRTSIGWIKLDADGVLALTDETINFY